MEPRWAEVKERGNAALKAGKLDEIALYQGAFAITQQPFPQLLALEAIAEEHPEVALAKFATATGPTATPLMLSLLSPFPASLDAEQELMPGLVLDAPQPARGDLHGEHRGGADEGDAATPGRRTARATCGPRRRVRSSGLPNTSRHTAGRPPSCCASPGRRT